MCLSNVEKSYIFKSQSSLQQIVWPKDFNLSSDVMKKSSISGHFQMLETRYDDEPKDGRVKTTVWEGREGRSYREAPNPGFIDHVTNESRQLLFILQISVWRNLN